MMLDSGASSIDYALGNEGESSVMTLEPVGPVAGRFINDTKFISSIMGPYGSAKTTSCFQKIINAAIWQKPMKDGVRRISVCCIRATYSQLATNVMQDWFRWFPQTKQNWNGELNRHIVRREVIGVGPIEIIMWFRAMGDLKAEQVFKGMSLTILWLNEVDTLDPSVIRFGLPRVGRYHGTTHGWNGVIADFNAPNIDNWVYDLLVEKKLPIPDEMVEGFQEQFGADFGIEFHRQPSGLAPDAENLQNLRKGYYQSMMLTMSENDIRRFIHNEFGAAYDGQPVYPEFNMGLHYREQHIEPLPDWPIYGGIDGGRTPAGVFFQLPGYLRILSEVVIFDPTKASSDENIYLDRLGPKYFGELLRETAQECFGDLEVDTMFYDPSIDFGQETDAYDWLAVVKKEFPCRYKPGGDAGNRVEPRLEALRHWFNTSPGGKPGVLIGQAAPVLRRALAGGYTLQQRKTSTGMTLAPRPDKGPLSHVANALEHGVLGHKLRGKGLERQRERQSSRHANSKVKYGGYAGALR